MKLEEYYVANMKKNSLHL